jgi:hypothetical protein
MINPTAIVWIDVGVSPKIKNPQNNPVKATIPPVRL